MQSDSLRKLYAELRRLKMIELLRAEAMKPAERAYREERIRDTLRMVEEKIEGRMRNNG